MGIKKNLTVLALCGSLIIGGISPAFADGANVVTLGKDLSAEQKQVVLDYFGVKKNEVAILEVNNQEERKYLEGIAPEAQIGHRTYSCAYVQPTEPGSGVKVKTVNLTYVTSSMIASTLATSGIEDANVIAMTPLAGGVSGTGALTGVMKAFEDATGEKLDETKKELASEELVITGDIGKDVGQEKATGAINDIKTEIIKNNTKDTVQIAETINNVTNNYNITLTPKQQKDLEGLMAKISKQDYNYESMKNTLENVGKDISDKLDVLGESISTGFFDKVKNWFSGIGDWFAGIFKGEEDLGILGSTNDEMLGESVKVDATEKDAIKLSTAEEAQGFFNKIWNWFKGLFTSDSKETETSTPVNNTKIEGASDTNSNNNDNKVEEESNSSENAENTSSEESNLEQNKDNNQNESTNTNESTNGEEVNQTEQNQ